MTILTVGFILAAAVATGGVLGLDYLRRVRRPVLIGAHLLLGAGTLEQTVLLVSGTEDAGASKTGIAACALLAAALAIGLLTSLVARESRRLSNAMVAAHIGLGSAAVVLFLAWVALRAPGG